MEKKIVHLVHCIDTEGPLYESLSETFERIRSAFGIQLEPSADNLNKLQQKLINLNGKEDAVALMVSPHLLNYNQDWTMINSMLTEAMSKRYRNELKDSYGNGWVFNWFCVDHIDYSVNPRRRDIGYCNVFDSYAEYKRKNNSPQDGLHFHFHPMSFDKAAHHCGTHYFAHSDSLFRILSFRVIERGWFPSAYRPGFNTIRPDSHWFLEQFIPFDFSNQSYPKASDQPDLGDGRFGDWRRAPQNWEPYHPDHDDHERAGSCRRYTARCLNVGTRFKLLDIEALESAFREASNSQPVIVGFADHDWRDIRKGVDEVRNYLRVITPKYLNVKYKFCEAREAMRSALGIEPGEPVRIAVEWKDNTLKIKADKEIFGPQPFFAVKTKGAQYRYENTDIHKPFMEWSYTFDSHSIPLEVIDKIGIAANDKAGNTTVVTVNTENRKDKCYYW